MGSSRFTRKVAIGLLAGATVVGLSLTAGSAMAAPQGRHPLNGSTPRWLHLAHDMGASPSSQQVNFGLLLGMRDQAGAVATLQAISDPASARYGQWLSNAAFDASYGPTSASVGAVQGWLRSQGFQVTTTLPSGMYVEASGSVAKVESVFGTSLHTYSYLGKDVRANATQLSLPTNTPAAVVSAVSGVVGVDQGSALKQPADTEPGPPPGARYGVQPCSAYYAQLVATDQPTAYGKSQPYAVCGYGPQQLQSAYGESGLLSQGVNGRGVTIAITDAYAAPTIATDAQLYNQVHHQPTFIPGQFTQMTPGPNGFDNADLCGAQGWYGEETLDVEAVHAMAPGARILYVGAPDCLSGLDDAWASTIDNHLANVITNSWTDGTDDINLLGTAYVAFYQQFSLEAALTGITVNFSSGDSGDHTAGGTDLAAKTVEFPADLPYVTGVGGTSVLIGSHGQWLGEYGWQNAYSTLANGAWTSGPARNLQLRRRRRDEPAVHPALLPGRQGACQHLRVLREHPDAGGAGHRDGRRPQHRLRGRRDPGVPGRHLLGSVPHRRDQPLLPAAGRRGGVGRPGARPAARVHQPLVLPAAGHIVAARHRGADLAAGPGPHRLRELPG